ncbi:hypothetical protein CHS0354_028952 [Potamilus streckersoni]|uniref:Uncharacterized protein n=1 Tax=Potamilus streckersoni TaxID=2493646 RepID=A0AAE0SAT3_9BIVA|nr:hypothetical protein CHS0354_028952 [Potamilus streckersoni]
MTQESLTLNHIKRCTPKKLSMAVRMLLLLVPFGLVTLVAAQGPGNFPCGTPIVQPIASRIVGGIEAKANSWPYVVSIVNFFFHK